MVGEMEEELNGAMQWKKNNEFDWKYIHLDYLLDNIVVVVVATVSTNKPILIMKSFCLNIVYLQNTEDGKMIVACIEDHQFQPKNYW